MKENAKKIKKHYWQTLKMSETGGFQNYQSKPD